MATNSPQQSNATANAASSIVTTSVDTGISIGENLLFAAVPWLGIIGVRQIVQLIFNFIAYYIAQGLYQVVVFNVIDTQVGKEETNFSQALKALRDAQASGDANAIATALKNFQEAAASLGNYDGSSTL